MSEQRHKPRLMRLPEPGELIDDRYRLVEAFASGGMGVIMRAEQLSVGRDVAVKLLHPHVADRDDFAARFKREAKVATLFDHASIVRVYDVGETDEGALYLVMELLDGEELKEVIKREAPLPVGRAIEITLQMLDGLAEAHSQEVIHRDIKPANVFIGKTRRGEDDVKLLDFGVAKLVNSGQTQLTATGRFTGTPSYIAPEVLVSGVETNKKAADIYAAGLVLLEMLTGQKAFDGTGIHDTILMHLNKPVFIPQEIAGTALGDVICKATRKHPEDRFFDADAMFGALRAAADSVAADLVLKLGPMPRSSYDPSSGILEKLNASGPDCGLEMLRSIPQHEVFVSGTGLPARQKMDPGRGFVGDGDDTTDLESGNFINRNSTGPRIDVDNTVPTMSVGMDTMGGPAIKAPPPAQATAQVEAAAGLNAPISTNRTSINRNSTDMVEIEADVASQGDGEKSNIAVKAVGLMAGIIVALVVVVVLTSHGGDDPDESAAVPVPVVEEPEEEERELAQEPVSVEEFEADDPGLAFFHIDTDPVIASVWSGDEELGETPFEFAVDVGEMPLTLSFRRDGYEEATREIFADDDSEIVIRLVARQEPEPRAAAPAVERQEPSPTRVREEVVAEEPEEEESVEEVEPEAETSVDDLIDRHLFAD